MPLQKQVRHKKIEVHACEAAETDLEGFRFRIFKNIHNNFREDEEKMVH